MTAAERLFLGALILVGIVLRVVDLPRPFDRQFDGFQASFFAVGAVDYERLRSADDDGLPEGAGAGYPVVNLELFEDDPDTWYVYANHPPLVPLVAWGAARLAGPEGWQEQWREGQPPEGLEAPLRAPFLAAHLVGAFLLGLALWRAGAPRAALYAGACWAWFPSSVLYAGLVNYEQPTLLALGIGAAGAVEYARTERRAWLLLVASGFALGGAVTYAPLIFAGVVGLIGLTRGLRTASILGATAITGGIATLAVHARRAGALLESRGEAPGALSTRVETLLGPMFDGSLPPLRWLAIQWELALEQIGVAGLALSLVGALWALAMAWRGRLLPALVAASLLAGGALVQLAFYRHTGDPQDPFLINLLPGLAACAGLALARAARVSPALAIVLTLAVVVESGLRTHGLEHRWRGANDADRNDVSGVQVALPHHLGPTLNRILPEGACAWYPERLGLGPAHSYYAWRTLLPVGPETYATTQVRQNALGLETAPTYLIAPTPAPAALAPAVEALLADLDRARPGASSAPEATADGWSAWRLR